MRNVCIFRNVKEVLVKNVIIHPPHPPPPPPLMIIRQHVQHVKNSKKSNPIPPFPQASFSKFATLPRDRKWHISKLATLPRAPYQPHATNNQTTKQQPQPQPQQQQHLLLQTTTTTTTTALHHTTSRSCEWRDHCNHCNHSKKHNSNHLPVHQWIRSAIHAASQQLTSPIVSVLSLKLPPPPCAVLLVHEWYRKSGIGMVSEIGNSSSNQWGYNQQWLMLPVLRNE